MSEHPNAMALEAFACGEPSSRVEAHVASCEACRAYVAKVGTLPPLSFAPPAPPPIRLVRPLFVLAPLAVAAAALLWVGSREPEARRMEEAHLTIPAGAFGEPMRVQLAHLDEPLPSTRFNGGVQLAVVRERAGMQERFTGPCTVRAGDRLRMEVAVDDSRSILGAVLADDGSWLELMPEGVRDAGTHFSEKSARIDSEPMAGTLIVGEPERVRAARHTHDFAGLRTLRIEIEGGER